MLLTRLDQELSSPVPQAAATTSANDPGPLLEQMQVSLMEQEEEAEAPSPLVTVHCQCLPFGWGRTSTLLASVLAPVMALPSKGSPCGKRVGQREEP